MTAGWRPNGTTQIPSITTTPPIGTTVITTKDAQRFSRARTTIIHTSRAQICSTASTRSTPRWRVGAPDAGNVGPLICTTGAGSRTTTAKLIHVKRAPALLTATIRNALIPVSLVDIDGLEYSNPGSECPQDKKRQQRSGNVRTVP